MDKNKNSEIKPFVFSDLQGSHVVTQPRPEKFQFQDLNGSVLREEKPASDTIRVERQLEQKSSFKIDKIVRDHRGLREQEDDDIEERISREVHRRVEEIHQKAFEQGLAEGRQEGIRQLTEQESEKVNEVANEIEQIMNQFSTQLSEATLKHKSEVLKFVNQFSKWVLTKEINEKEYISNLLEKLLHELNSRRNMIIKVNESSYQLMPEIVSALEKKLGTLSNIRIEVSPEMSYPGLIIESENGIVDATLENTFAKFDRFFEQVGVE